MIMNYHKVVYIPANKTNVYPLYTIIKTRKIVIFFNNP